MAGIDLCEDPIELLQKLTTIAPDLWECSKRCLILPQTLGEFYDQEYIEDIRNMLHKLNECVSMLNAGLISEEDYERRKSEILLGMQSSQMERLNSSDE